LAAFARGGRARTIDRASVGDASGEVAWNPDPADGASCNA
jgi:hypothetical protein